MLLNSKMELMDTYPSAKREIDLVIMAIDLEIVQEMLRLRRSGMPVEFLLPKLIRWLSQDINTNNTEAKWAVHSWAMAFGLISFTDEILLPIDAFIKPTIVNSLS